MGRRQNSVTGIRKRVFHLSEGSSKVKLSAGTLARPSALPRNLIIPPIIAVTLSWPVLFPAVTHNFFDFFLPKISDWIPSKHRPLSPPPHSWPWQERASDLLLQCLLTHSTNKNSQKMTDHCTECSAVNVPLDVGGDESGSDNTADSLMVKCADSGRVLVPSGLQPARSGWAIWKNCNTTQ